MINNTNILLNSIEGWKTGQYYSFYKKKENTIKHGKNYYLSTPFQSLQILKLSLIIGKVNDLCPPSPLSSFIRIFTKFKFAALASIPTQVFFACVKHDDYEKFAQCFNKSLNSNEKISWIPLRLPKKLGNRTTAITNFFAEHTGDIIRIAMITGSVAIIIFGNPYFGSAILVNLGYNIIDELGFVPSKISYFIESYTPIISIIGIITNASPVAKGLALIELGMYLSQSQNKYVQQKMDLFASYFFGKNTITLQEIDSPVITNRELTFDEINTILNKSFDDYKINPAHCSKPVSDLSEFATDTNYDKFLSLFDQVNWIEKYDFLKNKLKDDDNFIAFLKKTCSSVNKEKLKENFHDFIDKVALENNQSKEELAANWIRQQLFQLVQILKETPGYPLKGSRTILNNALKISCKIIPYLESIQVSNPTEFEDVLLKLAIEAGDYCSDAILRVSKELNDNILQNGLSSENTPFSPMRNYELKILRSLQTDRLQKVQNNYDVMNKQLHLPSILIKDTHFYKIFDPILSLGFLPLDQKDRDEFNLYDIIYWRIYHINRTACLYIPYYNKSLNEAVIENGTIHFGLYIQSIISNNSNLTDEQKTIILDKFTENNNSMWSNAETQVKFQRLMYVMLGVLSEKLV